MEYYHDTYRKVCNYDMYVSYGTDRVVVGVEWRVKKIAALCQMMIDDLMMCGDVRRTN